MQMIIFAFLILVFSQNVVIECAIALARGKCRLYERNFRSPRSFGAC
jgi:hypothetical protein